MNSRFLSKKPPVNYSGGFFVEYRYLVWKKISISLEK
jgi:hypothetical protein